MYELYYDNAKNYIRLQLQYITIYHIISLIIVTILSSVLIRVQLLKWIYVGIMIVTAVSMYKVGNHVGVGENIISLAIL
jgi:hypothetical protein